MQKEEHTTTKKKRGPKPKTLDEEQIAQVEALSSYLTQDQIADYFGMTKMTFHQVMKRQPEVETRYKKGKAKAIAMVAKNLVQNALDGDKVSQIFYLKTQAGWRETTHVDHTSNGESVAPLIVETYRPNEKQG